MTRTPSINVNTDRGDAETRRPDVRCSKELNAPRLRDSAVRVSGFDGGCDFLLEDRLPLRERSADAATRRVFVPAAAEFLCDDVDVDVAFGPQADTPVARPVLLEEHDCEHLFRREREIDEAL